MNDLTIQIAIEKLEQSGEEIRKLVNDKIHSDDKYYTDLFALPVADRGLKNSRGFITLIETKNSICAATLCRCQIDNLARFYGIKKYDDKNDYVYTFLDPNKRINNLKINGALLTDGKLVEILNADYPGLKPLYKETCRYAHLSEMHLRASSQIEHDDTGDHMPFYLTISPYDLYLQDISYLNIAKAFLNINNIFLKELEWYFTERNNFSNNLLPNRNR